MFTLSPTDVLPYNYTPRSTLHIHIHTPGTLAADRWILLFLFALFPCPFSSPFSSPNQQATDKQGFASYDALNCRVESQWSPFVNVTKPNSLQIRIRNWKLFPVGAFSFPA